MLSRMICLGWLIGLLSGCQTVEQAQQAEARRAAEARATRRTAPLTQARQALDPTWGPGQEGWGQAGGCLIL